MKQVKGMKYAEYIKSTHGNPSCYHLYNDLYEINIYVVIGQKEKVLKTWDYTKGRLDSQGCTFTNSEDSPVVWLPRRGEIDAFAHELIHVISIIYNDKGIEYDADNDEPTAYLMSWLMRGFYNVIK